MPTETKACQNCKTDFIIEPEDFDFYKTMQVPAPTFCPQCRMVRRMVWRNDMQLYRKKDDRTGKVIFSAFSDDSPVKVWDVADWNSDIWDATEYAREYDWNRPFFEQLQELYLDVPKPSRNMVNAVRSDYSNNSNNVEDCYLVFAAVESRSLAYTFGVSFSSDSYDVSHGEHLELCYEDSNCTRSFKTYYSNKCQNARDSYFCDDCVEISNCIGCVGLRKKQYCIFNKQYSKEEYFEKLKEFDLGSRKAVQRLKEECEKFILAFPRRFADTVRAQNSSGEYLHNTEDVTDSFNIISGEHLRYCQDLHVPGSKDCYDMFRWGQNAELIYESAMCGGDISRLKFSYHVFPSCHSIQYGMDCRSSSDLFGCVGLKKKQYCILNKQYTKEEYEEMIPKITQHMNDMPYVDKRGNTFSYGEFFPSEFSPYAYNETTAQTYFPLTKDEAIAKGYRWKDPDQRSHAVTIQTEDLPDHISDVDDGIISEVIECAHKQECNDGCTCAFRIVPAELRFYKEAGIPLPSLCPQCRHAGRAAKRNKPVYYQRRCMCEGKTGGSYANTVSHAHGDEPCSVAFQTSYSPDRPEIVYCEKCYQSEVL
ncbi:MAG: hypothetical protein Q8P93_01235 [bacterium]|nr:hypothetical protein [bacterium]